MVHVGTRLFAGLVVAVGTAAVARHARRSPAAHVLPAASPSTPPSTRVEETQPRPAPPTIAPTAPPQPSAPARSARRRRSCLVGLAFGWLRDDVAAEVKLIVADRSISSRDAARLLAELGVKVSHQTVNRHRNRALPQINSHAGNNRCNCRITYDPWSPAAT